MTVKRILIHPITVATLLVIVTPILVLSYWIAAWLILG